MFLPFDYVAPQAVKAKSPGGNGARAQHEPAWVTPYWTEP